MIKIKDEPVTKRPAVTKDLRNTVTKTGRPRKHASAAQKQKAYRERKAKNG